MITPFGYQLDIWLSIKILGIQGVRSGPQDVWYCFLRAVNTQEVYEPVNPWGSLGWSSYMNIKVDVDIIYESPKMCYATRFQLKSLGFSVYSRTVKVYGIAF